MSGPCLIRLAACAALAALPLTARAAPVAETNFQLSTGADLAALCESQPDDKYYTAAQNFCEGFAIGIYRAVVKQEAAMGHKSFCLPDPAPTRDQAKVAFTAFMAQSTEGATASPEDSVLAFLQHQYPCGGRK